MKKLTIFYFCLILGGFASGKTVSKELAQSAAINYYQNYANADITDFSVKESFATEYNDLTTYYTFNFSAGGFIIASADDAIIPILGYSQSGYIEKEISNPAAKAWFEGYGKEIYQIVKSKSDNNFTKLEWNKLLSGSFKKSASKTVGPFISSNWDQGKWYNYYCPADSRGPGGKAYAGCVATACGMIMKYYNFPDKGLGSHSYQSYNYGIQTADFGGTTYNWAQMDTFVTSENYQSIATLLNHIGIAVDMNYGPDESGAPSENIVSALVDYFNYDASTIRYIMKDDYTSQEWEQILRNELDHSRPVFYAGYSYENGHAFVCDGYEFTDNKFHFNWGYSGSYNGYYVIGGLNPFGDWYNLRNEAVIGIKPGNPNLVVRISDPLNKTIVPAGKMVKINASVYSGNSSQLNLFINDELMTSVNASSLSYDWNTEGLNPGSYQIKVAAMNATDTVFHSVSIGLGNWIKENNVFNAPGRGIAFVHAVDSSVVWAIGTDGINTSNFIQEFTKTVNGGDYWTPGIINDCSGLVPSMIFALNADTAYCPMYRVNGSNKQGIYVTRDGGKTWTHQSSGYFETPGAFPNIVHFFDKTDGWYMGDPIYNIFMCATTTDGGNNWTLCPVNENNNALSGEKATTGYYSAVGDHVWFGTTKGRVYRSADKGYTWNVSKTTLASESSWVDVVIDVAFADEYHGLAQDRSRTTTGALSETFDSGVTWQNVLTSGPVFYADLSYVPGTGNTWVSCGFAENASGASYSYDGGHTWQLFSELEGVQFLSTDWVSNRCGWLGSFSNLSNKNGIYKYAGAMPVTNLTAPLNLAATLTNSNVHLTWDEPAGTSLPVGYNIYRNNQLLTPIPLQQQSFDDIGLVNANYTYCVSAVYADGESTRICSEINVAVAINEIAAKKINIFPNPVKNGLLTVSCISGFKSVRIINAVGQLIYENNYNCAELQIITTGFKPGIYLLQVDYEDGLITQKIAIQ